MIEGPVIVNPRQKVVKSQHGEQKSQTKKSDGTKSAPPRKSWAACSPTQHRSVILPDFNGLEKEISVFISLQSTMDQICSNVENKEYELKARIEFSEDEAGCFVATFSSIPKKGKLGKSLSPKGLSLTKKLIKDRAVKRALAQVCKPPRDGPLGIKRPRQLFGMQTTEELLLQTETGCLLLKMKEAVAQFLDDTDSDGAKLKHESVISIESIRTPLENLLKQMRLLPAIFMFWCHAYSNVHKLIQQGTTEEGSPSNSPTPTALWKPKSLSKSEHHRYQEMQQNIADLISKLELRIGDSSWLNCLPKFQLGVYNTYWNQHLHFKPGDVQVVFRKPFDRTSQRQRPDELDQYIARDSPPKAESCDNRQSPLSSTQVDPDEVALPEVLD